MSTPENSGLRDYDEEARRAFLAMDFPELAAQAFPLTDGHFIHQSLGRRYFEASGDPSYKKVLTLGPAIQTVALEGLHKNGIDSPPPSELYFPETISVTATMGITMGQKALEQSGVIPEPQASFASEITRFISEIRKSHPDDEKYESELVTAIQTASDEGRALTHNDSNFKNLLNMAGNTINGTDPPEVATVRYGTYALIALAKRALARQLEVIEDFERQFSFFDNQDPGKSA